MFIAISRDSLRRKSPVIDFNTELESTNDGCFGFFKERLMLLVLHLTWSAMVEGSGVRDAGSSPKTSQSRTGSLSIMLYNAEECNNFSFCVDPLPIDQNG